MQKHTILFLAANPIGTSELALGKEARAIQEELERSGYRDCFELETRWAAQPLDLLRELRKLKPTVVHFSGRGGLSPVGTGATASRPSRDVIADTSSDDIGSQHGLFFQGPDGRAQVVTAQALHETFGAAGSSVKLVVLNACYSDVQAEALRAHVDCIVGMSGPIGDVVARNFAIGFYGGLGERESVATAFLQGCAAISLEGLRDSDRPQLKVRDGIDASKLVLGFPLSHVEAHDTGAVGVQPEAHRTSSCDPSSSVPKVDIGILTIRDDEFRAVLDAFPQKAGAGVHKGANRQYILRHADVATGELYTVAILRQVEHETGEAQHAARDLMEDLAPKLVLVVGIAGGLPSYDITLGDVVLGTRIHDYTVEAVKTSHEVTYAETGGPIDQAIGAVVATLAGREDDLGDWTSGLPSRPMVAWRKKGQVYGPPKWRRELRAKLEHHFGPASPRRAPTYVSGPIASSDHLVKDPNVLFPWITMAHDLIAVEMESGGVYRAARERCPMLPIRGISDLVGLRRVDAWTKFACASAAAFTRAFLRTRPVSVSNSSLTVAGCIAIDTPLSSQVTQGTSAMKLSTVMENAGGTPSRNDRTLENVDSLITASKDAQCAIVIRANIRDFNANSLARIVDTLRYLTGDVTLQITNVEEGSVRLIVTLSPTAAKVLLELRRKGQLAQLCGFDVSDVVELPEVARSRPAESVALDWARGHDPSRDIVYGRAKQPPRSRVDHIAEEAALACVRSGQHNDAIKILMRSYGDFISAFALRVVRDLETAKDVRQQVFLDAFRNIEKIASGVSFWSWLCGIAYHRCLDELRRARRRAAAEIAVPNELVSELDPMLDRVEGRRALENYLGKLGSGMRTLLLMRYSLGLSYAEIGDLVGASPSGVEARISKTLPSLRRYLREQGVDRALQRATRRPNSRS